MSPFILEDAQARYQEALQEAKHYRLGQWARFSLPDRVSALRRWAQGADPTRAVSQ